MSNHDGFQWLDTWPWWWGLVVVVGLILFAVCAHWIAPGHLNKHAHVTWMLILWCFFFTVIVAGTSYAAISSSRMVTLSDVTLATDASSGITTANGTLTRDDGGNDVAFEFVLGDTARNLGLAGIVAPSVHDFVTGAKFQLAKSVASDVTALTSDAQLYRTQFGGSTGLWAGLGFPLIVLAGVGLFGMHRFRDRLPAWMRHDVA